MWNPQEHIDDLMAVGYTKEEAVAETRAYAALRQAVSSKARKEYAAREARGDEERPLFLTLHNRAQRANARRANGQLASARCAAQR